jgi:RNA polymerase sigma-70 factor (ECF subfamily)
VLRGFLQKVMKDPNVDNNEVGGRDLGSTSSSLLERARREDAGAWERLTVLYGPLAYGWARRAGLQPEDAADVTQEVFRAVAAHLTGFRRAQIGDTFRGWLWTVTRNKVRDHCRRKAKRPEAVGGTDAHLRLLQLPDTAATFFEDSAKSLSSSLLTRALDLIRSEFEDRSWQAFWEVVVNGRSSADVAAGLGISVNAVYVARSRILRRLREERDDVPS